MTNHSTMTRRQMLHAGTAAAVSLGVADVLPASNPTTARGALPVKNLIWIQVNGGLSQVDTFDPKPRAPDGIRSPYRTIQTSLPGVHFTELLPRLAAKANKLRLIRTTHQIVPGSAHTDGSYRIMTGQSDVTKDHPYVGSVVARLNPATRPVPSYVWIQEVVDIDQRYRQGGAHAPFFVTAGYGAESAYGANFEQLGITGTLASSRTLTATDLRRRHALLEQVMPFQTPNLAHRRCEEFRQHQQNALALLTSTDTRAAFDLEQEPDALRQRYGLTPIGQNLLTARRLLERGVRAVGMPAGRVTIRDCPPAAAAATCGTTIIAGCSAMISPAAMVG